MSIQPTEMLDLDFLMKNLGEFHEMMENSCTEKWKVFSVTKTNTWDLHRFVKHLDFSTSFLHQSNGFQHLYKNRVEWLGWKIGGNFQFNGNWNIEVPIGPKVPVWPVWMDGLLEKPQSKKWRILMDLGVPPDPKPPQKPEPENMGQKRLWKSRPWRTWPRFFSKPGLVFGHESGLWESNMACLFWYPFGLLACLFW